MAATAESSEPGRLPGSSQRAGEPANPEPPETHSAAVPQQPRITETAAPWEVATAQVLYRTNRNDTVTAELLLNDNSALG